MKATSIVLALCCVMAVCTQSKGQEYFEGPGYITHYPGQQAQPLNGQDQYAQAQYQRAQFAQTQRAQFAQSQYAQFPQAQRPQVAQAGYAQSPYQHAHAAQAHGAQSQQRDYVAAAYQAPVPLDYDHSGSEFESECLDCVVEEHSRPSRLAGVYAGYSFAFTKLYMKESFEAYVLDFASSTQTLFPFDYDFRLTPRVWIGARNQRGVGARVSYWNYDESSQGFEFTNSNGAQIPVAVSTSVIFPAAISGNFPGDTLTVASSVKASTLDFEGTYSSTFGELETELAGGLRYARSDQSSAAEINNRLGLRDFAPQAPLLNWQRKFEGVGPVFSANGKLPMGNRGLYGVGGVGLSFLFGEKSIRRVVQSDSTPSPNTGLPFLNFENADEISGIYSVRIGLGHRRETKIGDAFLEGTYEGQLWTDLGAPTLTFAGFNSFNVNLGLNF